MTSWQIPSTESNSFQDQFAPKPKAKSYLEMVESWGKSLFGNLQEGGKQLSDISMKHAQKSTNKGYSDGSEEKQRAFIREYLDKWYNKETIIKAMNKLDAEWAFQGSWFDNPVSWTLSSVESGISKWIGTMFQGISDMGSAPLQDSSTAWVTRFVKGALETGLGSAQTATSINPVGLAVNTAFSSDTAWQVLQPITEWIEWGIATGQEALGFNPESSLSKDIQQIGSTAGNLALFAGAQKAWVAWVNGMKSLKVPNPVTGIKDTFTRDVPVGIVERELALTPNERANIEWINGKPAWAVVLDWKLPKDKQDMADALTVKGDEAYNGITEALKPINDRFQSPWAKESLWIMLDEMQGSKILMRTMKPYVDKLTQMIEQWDYSLAELNAIRRDFDRIIANKIFDSKGRVTGIEDKAIANIRRDLSDQIQAEAQKRGIDIKEQNDILRTSITLRDGVLRRLSQENKNNKIGIQDIWVWAILWAGNPLTTAAVIFWKKALEANAPWIAQRLYDLNSTPYAKNSMKRGVGITPRDTINGLSITPDNGTPIRVPVEPKTLKMPLKNTESIPQPKDVGKIKTMKSKKENQKPLPKKDKIQDILDKSWQEQRDLLSKSKAEETNITRNEKIQKSFSESAKDRWNRWEFSVKERWDAILSLKSNYKWKEYEIDGKKYKVDAIDNRNEQVRLVDKDGNIIRVKINKMPETKVSNDDVFNFYKDRVQKWFKTLKKK